MLRFQRDGYNVWLDEKNLDKTKNSWKEDALRAINSRRCQLVLFYVSATSLCSEPCLGELRETRSERTLTNHLDPPQKAPMKAVPALPANQKRKSGCYPRPGTSPIHCMAWSTPAARRR